MNRRAFLSFVAGCLESRVPAAEPAIPIIDTHIHLFDPTRPGGVPWPSRDDKILYRPALPARFLAITRPLGVVGAIAIEASPLVEDNQWVLDVAAKNTSIVGTVGNLEPGKPEFQKQFDRFHANSLFRGIRYGNLWGRNLGARLADQAFVGDLKVLASADLELDTANPDPALIRDVVRLTDKVPNLRVVIDHLPHLQVPATIIARSRYEADLRELGKRPLVFVKISEVLQRAKGPVSHDSPVYRAILDHLWDVFGQDRLLYGSDWPNSDPWGTYAQVLNVVRSYFLGKGRAAAEKYFWKNSLAAYRWKKRDEKQPQLGVA